MIINMIRVLADSVVVGATDRQRWWLLLLRFRGDHMKLSPAQLRVLQHAKSTMRPLNGHSLKTCASLTRRGLLTYKAVLICSTCKQAATKCAHRGNTRWNVWSTPTAEGLKALGAGGR